MIDLTKKYKTRDGRPVTGLELNSKPNDCYVLSGRIDGEGPEYWTSDGRFYKDEEGHPLDLIICAEDQPTPGLITPDPLRFEYGALVAAVKANFAAGTFATATQSQFDAWLESLTPSLRS